MSAPKLTDAQRLILSVAAHERNSGSCFAGRVVQYLPHPKNGSPRVCQFTVSAPAMLALSRRGFVTIHTSTEGGLRADITAAGRAALRGES